MRDLFWTSQDEAKIDRMLPRPIPFRDIANRVLHNRAPTKPQQRAGYKGACME